MYAILCSCGSGSPWRPWSPSSSAAASPPSSAAAADAAEKPHRLQSQLHSGRQFARTVMVRITVQIKTLNVFKELYLERWLKYVAFI